MALVVEDGTARTDADSYLSVVDLDAYMASHGYTTAATETEKEQALRKATAYLDRAYGRRWRGRRRTRSQALDWPRSGAYDSDGYTIGSDEVPRELRDATAEAARRALTADLEPDVAAGQGSIASESKGLGPLRKSVTYSTGTGPAAPRFPAIDGLLAPLLDGGGPGVLDLVRA